MRNTQKYTMLSLAVGMLLVVTMALPAWGQGIKERMKSRVPAIIALKNAGIVGEGPNGYLRFVGAVKKQQDIIQQENNDRKMVYQSVAAKQGIAADAVGKRRALKLTQIASPGHYLQKQDGSWYRK